MSFRWQFGTGDTTGPPPDCQRKAQTDLNEDKKANMWWSPDSDRDHTEGHWQICAPPFDKLQPDQKLIVLAKVGSTLL